MVKHLPANAGDSGSISGWGRSAGEGNGNAFQYSCLENPMDRGAWWATVYGVTESDLTTKTSYAFSVSTCHSLLCLTLRDPTDCSPPGSSAHGICQARILVTKMARRGLPSPSPGDLPNPETEPVSPTLLADSLPPEPPGKPKLTYIVGYSK